MSSSADPGSFPPRSRFFAGVDHGSRTVPVLILLAAFVGSAIALAALVCVLAGLATTG